MSTTRLSLILCALAAPFLANAQCPANPLQKLNGQTWVFEMHASDFEFTGSAAIGRFTASVVNGQGVLSVSETISQNRVTTRLTTGAGRYIVYSDCSGGELLFNVNGYAAQLEFVFINGSEIYLVTDSLLTSQSTTLTLTGTAKLAAVPACPAGVNPLATMLNTSWALRTLTPYWSNAGERPTSGSVGIFNPYIANGQGFLTAVETVNNAGVVSRLAPESGRYIIYPDCSGGEIMLMNRTVPVQFEFVFTSNNLDEMYMLNDSMSSSGFSVLVGQAKKRAVTAPCPADPLQFLNGSSWTFQSRGSQLNNPVASAAAIGRFSASVVNGQGTLSIKETILDGVTVTRGIQASGRYTVYPDCSGGELMFMVNRQAVQYEYVVVNNNELYFVSDSLGGTLTQPAVLVGSATRGAATACPAGVAPLSLVNGTSWAFRTFSPFYASSAGGFSPVDNRRGSASVGIFKPFVSSNGLGFLSAVETVNNAGQISRLAPESGRVIVYPDCSGGEIMLMNRNRPLQLEFVFTNTNFNDMLLLSDSTDGTGFTAVQGRARKQ